MQAGVPEKFICMFSRTRRQLLAGKICFWNALRCMTSMLARILNSKNFEFRFEFKPFEGCIKGSWGTRNVWDTREAWSIRDVWGTRNASRWESSAYIDLKSLRWRTSDVHFYSFQRFSTKEIVWTSCKLQETFSSNDFHGRIRENSIREIKIFRTWNSPKQSDAHFRWIANSGGAYFGLRSSEYCKVTY